MTRPSKKLRERFFAEAASKALGEAWCLEDISEPLDFIVHAAGEVFGLEITELHDSPLDGGGSSLMEARGRQQRNLREIVKKYYDCGGRSVSVTFLGDLSDPETIANCLLRKCAGAGLGLIIIETEKVKMWVRPLPSDQKELHQYERWQVADAGYLREIRVDAVELEIEKKALRLDEYRRKADRVDLLLVIDRTTAAGRFTVPQTASVLTRGFRRVILLNYPIDARILALE